MYNTKTIGLIVDVSLNHGLNGHRLIDDLKKELVNFIRQLDDEDLFYLFNKDKLITIRERGSSVAEIANYEPDWSPNELTYGLKQTLYIVSAQDTSSKSVIVITDRIDEKQIKNLSKIAKMNSNEYFDCKLAIITINKLKNQELLESICKQHNIISNCVNVNDVQGIMGEIVNGNEITSD